MANKILLIDDDDLVTQSIVNLLKRKGYQVIPVADGYSALEEVEKSEFDLIICDIRMPGLNGIETIKKIRHKLDEIGRQKPSEIFLTGYAEKKLEKEAKQLGVRHYFYKPFDIEQLISAIEEVTSCG